MEICNYPYENMSLQPRTAHTPVFHYVIAPFRNGLCPLTISGIMQWRRKVAPPCCPYFIIS